MTPLERTLVFWVPDWPIHAHLRDQEAEEQPQERVSPAQAADPPPTNDRAIAPIALIAQHRVVACSPAACNAACGAVWPWSRHSNS